MAKTYQAIYSETHSKPYDPRYVVVDIETGEILDDAQGYGYKTKQKAYAAYGYKTRDKSKDAEKMDKKKAVKKFCKEHKDFVGCLEADAFCIAKGSYAPDDKFDAKWVKDAFKAAGYTNLPFTASDFLKYWE